MCCARWILCIWRKFCPPFLSLLFLSLSLLFLSLSFLSLSLLCVFVSVLVLGARNKQQRNTTRERERERESTKKKKNGERERERCATTADLWFNRVDVCDTIDHNNLQSNLCSLSAVRCPLLVLVLVRLLLCFCPYRPSSCPLSRSLLRFPVLFSLRLHDKTR